MSTNQLSGYRSTQIDELLGPCSRRFLNIIQNGFNIGELKLFMLLDLNAILKQGNKGFVNRLSESLPKCKKVVVETQEREKRVSEYIKSFMGGYKTIKEPKKLD